MTEELEKMQKQVDKTEVSKLVEGDWTKSKEDGIKAFNKGIEQFKFFLEEGKKQSKELVEKIEAGGVAPLRIR